MYLSIGTPKNNIIVFTCPKIWAHYSLIIMWLNIGTPKNHHFPFETNGKEVGLGVPILKHLRVPHDSMSRGIIKCLACLPVVTVTAQMESSKKCNLRLETC